MVAKGDARVEERRQEVMADPLIATECPECVSAGEIQSLDEVDCEDVAWGVCHTHRRKWRLNRAGEIAIELFAERCVRHEADCPITRLIDNYEEVVVAASGFSM